MHVYGPRTLHFLTAAPQICILQFYSETIIWQHIHILYDWLNFERVIYFCDFFNFWKPVYLNKKKYIHNLALMLYLFGGKD